MAQNAAAAVPVLQPTIAAPLWLDPLYYVLPVEDEPYQQALQFRSMHTHSFSRLDGLCASLGYVQYILYWRPLALSVLPNATLGSKLVSIKLTSCCALTGYAWRF